MKIRAISIRAAALLTATFLSAGAGAATLDLTLEYAPDITNPSNNKFINTTRLSGFCTRYPRLCQPGEFSIAIPGMSAVKPTDANSTDPRLNNVSIQLDSAPKQVILTNKATGNTINATLRWSLVSLRATRLSNTENISAGLRGVGSSPRGGCSGRIGVGDSNFYTWAWGYPASATTCRAPINKPFSTPLRYHELSVGYTLTADNPLEVGPGDYTGSLNYTVGDGQQVDLFAENYSDNLITFNIHASVRHAFLVQFPAGSERVRLAPPEGWTRWLNSGELPASLTKDVEFLMTSSLGFNVHLVCANPAGTGCALKNDQSGEQVPFDIRATFRGFRTSSGQPVQNQLLTTQRLAISAPEYIANSPGRLAFKVNRPEVERMLKEPGSKWKGAVTVVFDTII
jgi:hypothetical protein